jgi:hypothetical protein
MFPFGNIQRLLVDWFSTGFRLFGGPSDFSGPAGLGPLIFFRFEPCGLIVYRQNESLGGHVESDDDRL